MNIIPANSENIKKAAQIIRHGGLSAFPTETVYGLGANGFDPKAVSKIFEAKNRPEFNPLILHIAELSQIDEIAEVESELAIKLMMKFWPGPLTLVLPKKPPVPEIVTAGNPTVAVRMPDNTVARELIKEACVPIAAPSANLFGRLSPTTAQHVSEQLGGKVNVILDGGQCTVGVESTIVKIDRDGWRLLRPGGLDAELLSDLIGPPKSAEKTATPVAPGMLPYHYAPQIPLKFMDETSDSDLAGKKSGGLYFSGESAHSQFTSVKVLSPSGDLREAAANLFVFLHEFEDEGVEIISAERFPEQGLGSAIMDRLKKAAQKFEE